MVSLIEFWPLAAGGRPFAASGLHHLDLSLDPKAENGGGGQRFGSPPSAGGGTRTPDTRIMIPLL